MKLRADISEDGTVTVEKHCADGQHDMVEVTAVDRSPGHILAECSRCGWKVLRTMSRSLHKVTIL